MEHKIPCDIIKDLMPLHVDELTSELSNTEIAKHLEECEECKERYNCMKSTMDYEKSDKQSKSKEEIDYLKKINIYQKRNLFLGSIISFLLGMTIPILKVTIPIMINLFNGGEIPAYFIARLNAIWYTAVFKIGISGFLVCALYLVINLLFKKSKLK